MKNINKQQFQHLSSQKLNSHLLELSNLLKINDEKLSNHMLNNEKIQEIIMHNYNCFDQVEFIFKQIMKLELNCLHNELTLPKNVHEVLKVCKHMMKHISSLFQNLNFEFMRSNRFSSGNTQRLVNESTCGYCKRYIERDKINTMQSEIFRQAQMREEFQMELREEQDRLNSEKQRQELKEKGLTEIYIQKMISELEKVLDKYTENDIIPPEIQILDNQNEKQKYLTLLENFMKTFKSKFSKNAKVVSENMQFKQNKETQIKYISLTRSNSKFIQKKNKNRIQLQFEVKIDKQQEKWFVNNIKQKNEYKKQLSNEVLKEIKQKLMFYRNERDKFKDLYNELKQQLKSKITQLSIFQDNETVQKIDQNEKLKTNNNNQKLFQQIQQNKKGIRKIDQRVSIVKFIKKNKDKDFSKNELKLIHQGQIQHESQNSILQLEENNLTQSAFSSNKSSEQLNEYAVGLHLQQKKKHKKSIFNNKINGIDHANNLFYPNKQNQNEGQVSKVSQKLMIDASVQCTQHNFTSKTNLKINTNIQKQTKQQQIIFNSQKNEKIPKKKQNYIRLEEIKTFRNTSKKKFNEKFSSNQFKKSKINYSIDHQYQNKDQIDEKQQKYANEKQNIYNVVPNQFYIEETGNLRKIKCQKNKNGEVMMKSKRTLNKLNMKTEITENPITLADQLYKQNKNTKDSQSMKNKYYRFKTQIQENQVKKKDRNYKSKQLNKYFQAEDLLIFGGVAESFEFQKKNLKMFTSHQKQSLFEQIPSEKKFLQSLINHLENIKQFKNMFYQNIVSFLTQPYTTIEKNQIQVIHLKANTIKTTLASLLSLHTKHCGNCFCEHLLKFYNMICFTYVEDNEEELKDQ